MYKTFRSLLPALILVLGSSSSFGSDAPPETRRQLLEHFNQAYSGGQFVEALRWGLALEDLRPGNAVQQYNLACVYALIGNEQTAIGWLRRAAANGFRRIDTLRSDEDLDTLRQHPLWPGILEVVQQNAEGYQGLIQRTFDLRPPDVYLPRDYDPDIAAPLIVALHGYGGRPVGYPTYWRTSAGKVGAILATPQGLQRDGQGYFWGDLEEAEAIVQMTIEFVRESHRIDDSRIILTGFSQGGFMAMAVALRHPKVFVGVIPMAGGYIPGIDVPPPNPPDAPRYYFMVGSKDEAKSQCRTAAKDFEAAGYPVDLRVYPGVGHTFPKALDRELGKALKFVLK